MIRVSSPRLSRLLRRAAWAACLALLPWPALAALHQTVTPLAPWIALVAAVAIGAAAYLWIRRKIAIFRDAIASVPRPRQLVDPDGKTVYATPAFVELFGGDNRPTPDYLAEQAADDEALDQIGRLARDACNGVPGSAEIRLRAGADAQGGDGGSVRCEWRYVAAFPVKNRLGYVYWLVDDVKPERQMDRLIQDERQRFADLLQDAPWGSIRPMPRAGSCS